MDRCSSAASKVLFSRSGFAATAPIKKQGRRNACGGYEEVKRVRGISAVKLVINPGTSEVWMATDIKVPPIWRTILHNKLPVGCYIS